MPHPRTHWDCPELHAPLQDLSVAGYTQVSATSGYSGTDLPAVVVVTACSPAKYTTLYNYFNATADQLAAQGEEAAADVLASLSTPSVALVTAVQVEDGGGNR